ncbi:MAG: 3-phosphoserine/phosphohydroxythreonine transaminase [Spirochaetales bacterium]|nr:3-phosphoserine/phosphohydroxythreonine transaminase [Spirochaetales bacterium]
MSRPVNFSAGPSMIPVDVLQSLATDMVDYKGTGLSLVEVSHRGPVYDEVHQQAIALIKELLGVPEGYSVLFVGGGATMQFSMLPMNLMGGAPADYVNTGVWAKKAIAEAKKVGDVNVVWDGSDSKYLSMPQVETLKPSSGAAYFHITSNETIGGVQYKSFPETGDVPLVADMSSDIMSRPLDVSKFGMIYAGAQKNLAPSGVTVVIIRDDLLARSSDQLGAYLSYAVHAKANSLYNTPPVFPIWAMKLVLEGVKAKGGVAAVAKENAAQAAELYGAIDDSEGFYSCPVDQAFRSDMNVVWRLSNEELESQFIKEASAVGLTGLKGHRSVGGCRASIYNAMTMDGVKRLTSFMAEFARKNG